MHPSALLISLSLLAAAAAADTYCVNDTMGKITNYPVNYNPVSIYPEGNVDFPNHCPGGKVGMFVSACSYGPPPPKVKLRNMDIADVSTAYTATIYGTAYCSHYRNAAHSEYNNLPLIGGALLGLNRGWKRPNAAVPWVEATPGAGMMPVREAVPFGAAVPGDRYHQLHWN